jgi:hypothetical protein
MKPNYIILQAWGHSHILLQGLYHLLSFAFYHQHQTKEITFIIGTDNPLTFKPAEEHLQIQYIEMPPQQRADWMGKTKLIHRLKIKLIQTAVELFPNANYLYVDSDTVYLQNVIPLFESLANQYVIMHQNEGNLALTQRPRNRLFRQALKLKSLIHLNNNNNNIDMWNAGVIGFQDPSILTPVLETSDLVYQATHSAGKYKTLADLSEQFAFSYYLSKYKIIPAENYLFHYWNFKEFSDVLYVFFEKLKDQSWEKWLIQSQHILPQLLEKPKRQYEALDFWSKAWRKLTGNKWQMPSYNINNN